MRKNIWISFILLLLAINCFAQTEEPTLYRQREMMLGTFVEIVSPDKNAIKTAFSEIKRLEDITTKFKEGADIYELNKKRSLKVQPETIEIIEKAKYFYDLTNGAFDITAELGKKSRGLSAIIIDKQNQTVTLKDPNINIDLGGIGDGYILDKVVALVKKQGVSSMLINAGGDIYCLGKKSKDKPWEIGIQNPYIEKDVLKIISLENKAITTSGTYQQPKHIINPKTGKPAQSNIVSVSIITNDCITADALATAAFVLGKDKALKMISAIGGKKIDAYIYTKKDIIKIMNG
ncbi:MAG: FAD:protein FMN transferase [Candidatus Omnitrophota bacterium]